MTENESEIGQKGAISASWERCERKHRLAQNALHPILRLQSSEVRPRSEDLVERTGGRLGIFKQVADIAVKAGYCFSIADADGVLVRREGKAAQHSEYESNGISLGSCWDERIAGTNGVSMALSQRRAFTVRGQEHYFSTLRPFACTGVPLHDAENRMIGVVNLATVDKGNVADYMFARQLLGVASDRIQRVLFERHFNDAMLVSISSPVTGDFLRTSELLAVDETGLIIGSTTTAHELIGVAASTDLVGQSFEEFFEADTAALDRNPEHAPYVRTGDGQIVRIARRIPESGTYAEGWRPAAGPRPARTLRLPQPSIEGLSVGSPAIAEMCTRAEAYLNHALPFVIQGDTGTGKSALVAALQRSAGLLEEQVVTVNCATMTDGDQDRFQIETIFKQARIVSLLSDPKQNRLMLVFDNIQEMPEFAQAALAKLLQDFEVSRDGDGTPPVAVIATARGALASAVQRNVLREDLYFLLTNTVIAMPPLARREEPGVLIRTLATRLAGGDVEITADAMKAMMLHDWPGNVRELRSVLQQALMDGDGSCITLTDLRATSLFDQTAQRLVPTIGDGRPATNASCSEEDRVLDALISAKWNVSQAARSLGIGRATIHRKMKQFRITRPS